MIRVAGQDGNGTIELFGQHDACKLVRPCRAAESECERGPVPDRFAVTIRTADQESHFRGGVAKAGFDQLRKLAAGLVAAGFIEDDDKGIVCDSGEEGGGFLLLAIGVHSLVKKIKLESAPPTITGRPTVPGPLRTGELGVTPAA